MSARPLLVVDWRVEDAPALLEGADPALDILYLERDRDGVEQIAGAVRGRSEIPALHVLSHGAEAALWLGSGVLDRSTLAAHELRLREIGAALADRGDLLLYGCNVAAGTAGGAFVRSLAEAMGVGVCASRNLTGSAALGGDWKLEETVGTIAARLPFNGRAMAGYRHVFGSDDRGIDALVQPDGKILVAGVVGNGADNDFALWRYNADGSPDTSFDGDGRLTTDFGASRDEGQGIALRPDGKILVGGSSFAGNYDFALARYNADGSLDTSFGGGDGKVTTALSAGHDVAYGVLLQSDDKIVLAGYANDGNASASGGIALVRYHADGSLDTSFGGGDGIVVTAIGAVVAAYRATLDDDGKILVAGSSYNGANYDFALARYDTDGSLDTSFGGGDGVLTTAFGAGDDSGRSVVVHDDDKIVVVGNSWNGSIYEIALARYNADGTLDASFGGDGKVTTPVGTNEQEGLQAIALQPDGKIVVAGVGSNGSNDDFAVVRYNTDGSLDTTFGGDGIVLVAVSPGGDDNAFDVVIRPDGSIFVAGQSQIVAGSGLGYAILDADGTVLVGSESDEPPPTEATLNARGIDAVLQSDGKILVAGYTLEADHDFVLWRYNADGTLDNGFSDDGIVTTAVGASWDEGQSVALQSDGKILVAGSSLVGGFWDFSLVRYNADGSLDTSFDGDGKLTTALTGGHDVAYQVLLQADGRIVLSGYSDNKDFALARYNADGSLDTSFDGDGIVATSFGVGSFAPSYRSALQPDGKIVVAGSFTPGPGQPYDFALARYNTDGSLDTSFDGDGKLTTAFGAGDDFGRSVAVQSDGKIVVVGNSFNGAIYELAVARYNADGSLDTSFGGDGKVTTAVGTNQQEGLQSVALQPDGRILVAGVGFNGTNDDFAVVRYNTDGSLDATFDEDGILVLSVGPGDDNAFDVVIRPDGSMVAVGQTQTGTGLAIGLVIIGTEGDDDLVAGSGDDTILGFGGNDVLNGKGGADSMIGGGDDDRYYVNHARDEVLEELDGGVDRVLAKIDYALDENFENLRLLGTQALDGTGNASRNQLIGNDAANVLTGGQGKDTLLGLGGDDVLIGSAGRDDMRGGDGEDLYYVNHVDDVVFESSNGPEAAAGDPLAAGLAGFIDTVVATVNYSLRDTGYVENLLLSGAAVRATGNGLANVLRGTALDNVLDGKGGNDRLTGRAGEDVFAFTTKPNGSSNRDTITDFMPVDDTIRLENEIFTAFGSTGTLASGRLRSGAGVKTAADADDNLIYDTSTGALYYDADASGTASAAVRFATLLGKPVISELDFVVV